jgi:hypothetical protein
MCKERQALLVAAKPACFLLGKLLVSTISLGYIPHSRTPHTIITCMYTRVLNLHFGARHRRGMSIEYYYYPNRFRFSAFCGRSFAESSRKIFFLCDRSFIIVYALHMPIILEINNLKTHAKLRINRYT